LLSGEKISLEEALTFISRPKIPSERREFLEGDQSGFPSRLCQLFTYCKKSQYESSERSGILPELRQSA